MKMNIKTASIISGIFLLLAIPQGLWPYSYYIILRWVVFASAIYNAYSFYQNKNTGWALVFGSVAFLFNPIFSINLGKSSWVPIDFIVALLFFLIAYHKKVIGDK